MLCAGELDVSQDLHFIVFVWYRVLITASHFPMASGPSTCHQGECPPCSYLVEKECVGGHKFRVSNVPCHAKNVSCGQSCLKTRVCGKHLCMRSCHGGPCDAPGVRFLTGVPQQQQKLLCVFYWGLRSLSGPIRGNTQTCPRSVLTRAPKAISSKLSCL